VFVLVFVGVLVCVPKFRWVRSEGVCCASLSRSVYRFLRIQFIQCAVRAEITFVFSKTLVGEGNDQ
jgi:hypothetical protein